MEYHRIERVFIISIREDIDKGYKFPEPFPLELRLKDMLDDEVDEKYYLSENIQDRLKITDPTFTQSVIGNRDLVYQENGVMGSLTATDYKQPKQIIRVREATKQGYAEAHEGDSINLEQPNSKTRRGRVGHGVAQTLTTSPQQATVLPELRIRKLTPLECFRLMGFSDDDFHKAEKVNSNTQLYKQAGNSIVVDVIEEIYEQLFSLYWNEVK